MQKTAIVVPCYNEQSRLSIGAFEEAIGWAAELDFVFVDDGSQDKTWEMLSQFALRFPERVHIIQLEANLGKAGAVQHGIKFAAGKEYTYVGFWDADLATPLSVILEFVEIADSTMAEFVIGSRVKLKGRQVERKPIRHYFGRIFATAAYFVYRDTVYDTQCGAKLFRNNDKLEEVFRDPFVSRWIFDVECIARYASLSRLEGRINLEGWLVEVPLREWRDVDGSKLRPRDFFASLFDLLRLVFAYRGN